MLTTHLHSCRSFTLVLDELFDVLDANYAEQFGDDFAKTIDRVVGYYESDCAVNDLPIRAHGSGSDFECPINQDCVLVFRRSTDRDGPGNVLAVHIYLKNIEFLPESMPE
jgi:hypothetical protein